MATEYLRLYWNHLGRRLAVIVSSQTPTATGEMLESGALTRYWEAASTDPQYVGYDVGQGLTESVSACVIPGADYLVAHGFSVDVRWSADGTPIGTSVGALTNGLPPFPWTPITAAHLADPDARHAVAEWAPLAKRGWYLHLYGVVAVPARLEGSLFLGPYTRLPKSPSYGRGLGPPRTYRGRDVETSFPIIPTADAAALAGIIAAITDEVEDGAVTTVAGYAYGGSDPVWLYDRTGRTFNGTSGRPYLLPVCCVNGQEAMQRAVVPGFDEAPQTLRWRERT